MATQTRFSKREFSERFARLQRKHQRWITDALGDPPDPRNIPKSLWEQIEKEEAAAYLVLMSGLGLQSLQFHSRGVERKTGGAVTQADLRQELQRQSVKRATWAARQTTGTVRRKVRDVILRDEDLTPKQVVDNVWTPARAKRIIENESVAATTNGATAVVEVAKKKKLEVFHIWQLGTCKHCEVCPLLHKTDESYWGDVTSGPPLHVNCCCMTVVEFGTREELIQQGKLLARFPSQAQLMSAIRRSGWKL
jgi:hypothetical protein